MLIFEHHYEQILYFITANGRSNSFHGGEQLLSKNRHLGNSWESKALIFWKMTWWKYEIFKTQMFNIKHLFRRMFNIKHSCFILNNDSAECLILFRTLMLNIFGAKNAQHIIVRWTCASSTCFCSWIWVLRIHVKNY